MNIPRYGKNICPKCGIRERQPKRTYCLECENKRKRLAYHNKRHTVSPEFRALMQEAQDISFQHLKDMGLLGRAHDANI